MKKLVAFTLLAVAVAFSFAASRSNSVMSNRVMEVKNDTMKGVDGSFAKNGEATSLDLGEFDKSSNGYGWYKGDNNKIAYDVASGVVGGTYRKKFSPEITGKLGGYTMAAPAEGATYETDIILNESSQPGYELPGGRYPHTMAANGYIFSFYNDYWNGATNSNALLASYCIEEEEWRKNIPVANEDGETPPGAWTAHGDVTYDEASGNYYALSTWQIQGLATTYASRKEAFVVGSTDDPYEGDWEWSAYSDHQFDASAMTDVSEMNELQAQWGTGGFGIVYCLTNPQAEEKDQQLSYMITTDFGETWSESGVDGNPFITVENSDLFSWAGEIYTGDDGTQIAFDDPFICWNLDAVVTDNNTVHILARVYGGSTADESLYYASDEQAVAGYYDIRGTLNNSGEMVWDSKYIATWHGIWSEEGSESKYSNGYSVSMAYAGGENIVVSWLDRPADHPIASPWGGDEGSGAAQFIDDAFVATSTDNGQTWAGLTDGQIQFEDNDPYPVKFATNATNTEDLHEQGWALSSKASYENEKFTFYAACQYYDAANPLAGEVADFEDHEQFLHAWKLEVVNNAIETQDINLAKDFALEQNYPNPFNPSTSIKFNLATAANVELAVFNTAGQEVAKLVNNKIAAGAHSVNFNAADLNSGVYFYQLKVNGMTEMKKMVLTK